MGLTAEPQQPDDPIGPELLPWRYWSGLLWCDGKHAGRYLADLVSHLSRHIVVGLLEQIDHVTTA